MVVKGKDICPKDCPDRNGSCHRSCKKYREYEAARLREQMQPSTAYGWWTHGKTVATEKRKREAARRR